MAWLTVTEAASRYPLSKTHIRDLAAAGVIKSQKVGPLWTVDEASLRRYLDTDRRPGPAPKKPR